MLNKLKSMFGNQNEIEVFNAKKDVIRSGYRAGTYMDGDKLVFSLHDALTDEVIIMYVKDMDEINHILKILETDIKNDFDARVKRIKSHNEVLMNKMNVFYSKKYPFIALSHYRKLMSINAFDKKGMTKINNQIEKEILVEAVE